MLKGSCIKIMKHIKTIWQLDKNVDGQKQLKFNDIKYVFEVNNNETFQRKT